MEIRVTDNSKIFKNAKDQAVEAALQAMGHTAERYAKANCPTDTSRLKNSITFATQNYSGVGVYQDKEGNSFADGSAKGTREKDTVYIGTNVEYAEYVELKDSSHKTGQAHFLRDAAATHGDEYKRIAETQLRKA